MNLVIDIGNSSSKIALYSDNQIIEDDRFFIKPQLNWFQKMFEAYKPDHSIVCSTKVLTQDVLEYLNSQHSLVLTHETPLPIVLDYKSIDTLGRDRIAASVGAKKRFPNDDCLVIDLGTCITYDFITRQDIYKGGAISPGLKMRFKAMNEYTDNLPIVEKPKFIHEFGKDTRESLSMGGMNGIVHEINGFIRLFNSNSKRLKVILTGGDISLFEQHLEIAIFAAPNLVLDGLNEVLLYNKQLNE